MQRSQMFNMPKNAIWQYFHHQLLKSALETQIKAYAAVANDQHAEIAIWLSFHHQHLKSTLETQVKAYAALANVKHAGKRYLAVFSYMIFEICSRNANEGICSIRICSTCRKTLFGSVFIIIYKNLL